MKVNPLVRLTIEEVVALCVTRVQSGIVWRRERTVPSLIAVESKGTRKFLLLPTCCYTEVWNSIKYIREHSQAANSQTATSRCDVHIELESKQNKNTIPIHFLRYFNDFHSNFNFNCSSVISVSWDYYNCCTRESVKIRVIWFIRFSMFIQ